MNLLNGLKKFARDERGMETVEWGVLAAVIVVGLATAVVTLGNHIMTKFNALKDATS
ncbi:MAG: Flp/Fap pilin component [Phycisphaerales bacterium]|jgi:Flp pilus assembly pilin Flp|nr:Flp/Fap pilin component [Phycisphaerales bacterium]